MCVLYYFWNQDIYIIFYNISGTKDHSCMTLLKE